MIRKMNNSIDYKFLLYLLSRLTKNQNMHVQTNRNKGTLFIQLFGHDFLLKAYLKITRLTQIPENLYEEKNGDDIQNQSLERESPNE